MKKFSFILATLSLVLTMTACTSNATNDPGRDKPSATPTATTEAPVKSPEVSTEPGQSETPAETSPSPEPTESPAVVSPIKIDYPDAVRGVYVTGWSAGGERLPKLVKLMDDTDLNAMVIDIKDDDGYITFKPEGELASFGQPYIKDVKALMKTLEAHKIYPIARIVAFKDSVLAKKHPELSYVEPNGSVWKNGRGEAFTNPFLKETWDHDLDAAKLAAELGFKEIQFDYVRFPEGFEKKEDTLKYSMGEYKDKKPKKFVEQAMYYAEAIKEYNDGLPPLEEAVTKATDTYTTSKLDADKKALDAAKKDLENFKKTKPKSPDYSEKARMTQLRVDAVSDFVTYAKEQLKPYGVQVSVDIFGYSATLPEAPGIGQNFNRIADTVDVISSMIYPSHWGDGYFGIKHPDLEPYKLVAEYAKEEKKKFGEMDSPPVSRPWIQDFTASWLGKGKYLKYGKAEVDAQIKALKDAGINEYLLWNAGNTYTANVEYTP